MNKATSLTFCQIDSPGMLLNAFIFRRLKKTKNKNPRESVIPIFNLKPGKYPALNRHSVNGQRSTSFTGLNAH